MPALNQYDFLRLTSYDDEAAFFAQMGRFFASATVRRDCGGYPLNDSARHRWFVVRRRGQQRLLGFVSIELQTGAVRIRDGYIRPEARQRGLFRELRRQVLEFIDERDQPCTLRVPRGCAALLLPHGFQVQTTRGNWVTLKRNTHATRNGSGEPRQDLVRGTAQPAPGFAHRRHQPDPALPA
ncbi:N-acetyltransferase [Achromobacter pulmonis]|uniref:N-acetyltransferase n=1 Tax=Achromobacter pulmonis TaxID=1389932 RepID=UPI00158261B2|nr:N-acetyltransferase [Achromobacter pulmonis]